MGISEDLIHNIILWVKNKKELMQKYFVTTHCLENGITWLNDKFLAYK